MCVATFIGSGVTMLSDASAVRDAAISGSNVVAVPAAMTVRAASSGVGVRVPWRATCVSVKRVSGEAPPQPLATRVSARLARSTQTERESTMALGGKRADPCGPACTMGSRPRTPESAKARPHRRHSNQLLDGSPWRGSCNRRPPAGKIPPCGVRAAAGEQSGQRVLQVATLQGT